MPVSIGMQARFRKQDRNQAQASEYEAANLGN
jgi:hypothetical protein